MGAKIALLEPDDDKMEYLRALAPDADVAWVDSNLGTEEQVALMQDAVVIFGDGKVEVARRCPNLKLVQVSSAGTDRLDVAGLAALGIPVSNGGGGNAIAVAEHAIALMLSVYRKLNIQMESAKAGKWAEGIRGEWWETAHELTGKTVGIIGLGHIGQNVAQRLAGWECELLYEDAVDRPAELEARLGVTRVSREDLLARSDVATLHVPLLDATRGMISDAEFDAMKDSAILINTCRGPVVDEAALIRGMRAGKIAGAGLDVLEEEPTPPDNPLLQMDHVVVTPHYASFAQEASDRSRKFALDNAIRVVNGEQPLAVVAPE
jgi:glyoxylate reductase/D-3-phosphoglycerate dehydrogenase